MALIKCPECGKEISDRAYSCPNCGFPIMEYLEEKEEEKEKELELQRKNERKKEIGVNKSNYNAEKVFTVYGKTISLNKNKAICAIVGSELNTQKNQLHKDVTKLIYDIDNGPTCYKPNNFSEYANDLAYSFVKATMMSARHAYRQVLLKAGYSDDEIDESNIALLDYENITNSLINVYNKNYQEYDLAIMNASVKYSESTNSLNDDYIQKVYASSLSELVKKDISSRIINSSIKQLKQGWVQSKIKKAEKSYGQTILKAAIKLNTIVFSKLDDYIDLIVETYQKYVLDVLVKDECLFEIEMYPKEGYDGLSIIDTFDGNDRSNEENIDVLVNCLINNPGMKNLYVIAFSYVKLCKNDIVEIIKLINFLGYKEEVIESLKEFNNEAYHYFDENFDYDRIVDQATFVARQHDGMTFDSVEMKEMYISEKNKYEALLNEISRVNWIGEKFVDLYNKLMSYGEPQSIEFKKHYDSIVSICKMIYNEISNNSFVIKIKDSVNLLLDNNSKYIEKFDIKHFESKKKKLLDSFQDLLSMFEETELPILRYQSNGQALLITTKAFYFFGNNSKHVLQKFDIEDIERVGIAEKDFFQSGYVNIITLTHKHSLANTSNLEDSEFKFIARFAKELSKFVANNSKLADQYIHKIMNNSQSGFFEYKNFEKESQLIAIYKNLITNKRLYNLSTEYLIFKWNYELKSQDSALLYKLYKYVERNNIGPEWFIYFDGLILLTNKRICFFDMFGDDSKRQDFKFDTFYEFCSCSNGSVFTGKQHRMYLFLDNRGNVIRNHIHKSSSDPNEVGRLIEIISSANLILRNCFPCYYNQIINYCEKCNKVVFSQMFNSQYTKITRCPICKCRAESRYENAFITYDEVKKSFGIIDEKNINDEINQNISSLQKIFKISIEKDISKNSTIPDSKVSVSEQDMKNTEQSIIVPELTKNDFVFRVGNEVKNFIDETVRYPNYYYFFLRNDMLWEGVRNISYPANRKAVFDAFGIPYRTKKVVDSQKQNYHLLNVIRQRAYTNHIQTGIVPVIDQVKIFDVYMMKFENNYYELTFYYDLNDNMILITQSKNIPSILISNESNIGKQSIETNNQTKYVEKLNINDFVFKKVGVLMNFIDVTSGQTMQYKYYVLNDNMWCDIRNISFSSNRKDVLGAFGNPDQTIKVIDSDKQNYLLLNVIKYGLDAKQNQAEVTQILDQIKMFDVYILKYTNCCFSLTFYYDLNEKLIFITQSKGISTFKAHK